MSITTSLFNNESGYGFKRTNGITSLTDNITLPIKDHQDKYKYCKYRAFNNSIYLTFYGVNDKKISLKYNDCFKLRFRTMSSTLSGKEAVLLTSYDIVNNGNSGTRHSVYNVKLHVRISYKGKQILIAQKLSKVTMTSNDASDKQNIEDIGILLSFEDFNKALDMVESSSTLENINYSTSTLDNDID